ncbi:hypothetical protein [Actinoplanes palleronii]|uniref:Uncharacterized protein n=1 Tax=Actinoplanes palleronii TaxID=113570 RepID=A0ABQ4AZU7_9ACTN|nr:hypothetical protein [Actinoplanes palleronii]GIE63951.1 hypothetical protein Apa02nite_000590 [Actinoplanes palleronii]
MANRFQLWGQAGWASAEVVGETHYAKAIRALFNGDFNPQGTDLTVPVQLIPDRSNRHDRNAVGVWSGTALLGHLPRPEAARYVHVLTALTKRNLVPEVNAQIHGREWGEYDGRPPAFVGTIRLDLAEPHMIVPANDPPRQEHRLLPTGSALQVNGYERHADALAPFQRPEGECWAYVTLHEMADHLVEVRLGDIRVGDLSPKMSVELTPVLRYQSERGLVVAARAIVKSNVNKTEVLLYVARVQDLPESVAGPAARLATSGRVAPVSPPATTTPVLATSTGPDLPAAGTSAVPSWMATSDAVPTWASAPSDAQPTWMDRSELVPSWVQASGPVPSWAASVSGPVPTIAGKTPAPEEQVVPGVPAHPIPGVPTSPMPGGTMPASPAGGSSGQLGGSPGQFGGSAPSGQPTGLFDSSRQVGPGSGLSSGPSSGQLAGPSGGQPAGLFDGSVPVSPAGGPSFGGAPTSPSGGPSFDGNRPVSPAGGQLFDGNRPVSPAGGQFGGNAPVSPAGGGQPAGLFGGSGEIAETTVIPALSAVMKQHAATVTGSAPVSPAPDPNRHPPIPVAPTGVKFQVPPGWPTPPDGWYPPEGWRPEAAWPLAPSGWQWWVPTWD